jgi:hypothetical protein
MKDVLVCLYSLHPSLIAATHALAAKRMLSGSISRAYQFIDNYADKAWAEQHRADHDVEQILYACHALVAIDKGFLNSRVSLTAYRNVNGVIFFYFAHAAGVSVGVTTTAAASASACAATAASCTACSSAVYST